MIILERYSWLSRDFALSNYGFVFFPNFFFQGMVDEVKKTSFKAKNSVKRNLRGEVLGGFN